MEKTEKEIKDSLKGVMDEKQIEDAVASLLNSGAALTRRSALLRLQEEKRPKVEIQGYYLGSYERKDGLTSVYIFSAGEVRTLSADSEILGGVTEPAILQEVKVTNVAVRLSQRGEEYLHMTKESAFNVIGQVPHAPVMAALANRFSVVKESGTYFVAGEVRDVESRGDFTEEGTLVGRKQILDQYGNADVRLILRDQTGEMNVSIKNSEILAGLLGVTVDNLMKFASSVSFNTSALQTELRRSLRDKKVAVFGRGDSHGMKGETLKRPWIAPKPFGFVRVLEE